MIEAPTFQVNISNSFKQDKKALKNLSQTIDQADELILAIMDSPQTMGEHFKTLSNNIIIKYLKFGRKPEYRIMFVLYDCVNNENRTCLANNSNDECAREPFKCQGIIDFFALKTREECNNYYKQIKNSYKVIDNT